jgi:ABC-2 type transport system ATP-binding protein
VTVPADAIRTAGLARSYGPVVAVQGLDLAVARAEIFGLVGPDGAGKTTTIRMLTTVITPTSGHASVLGLDVVHDAAALHSRVGYMAQRFTLYRDLTVLENLAFFADAYGVPANLRAARGARLLEFAGLGGFKDRLGGQLSGGMQKKLALACTLVHQPEVIFLDEPTTGVDPVSRREFWEILTELHLQGTTIFVSTPYMDEAERCSRVGLMYQGRLVVCDTPERLRARVGGAMLEVRTADSRRARQALAGMDGVRDVVVFGDGLYVLVDDAQARTAAVAGALSAAGVAVAGIRPTRPRMEEAFTTLVHGAEGGGESHGEGGRK